LSSIPRSTSFPRLAQSRSLRAFVLLDGSIRPTPFRSAIKRSLLDLPIAEGQRLLLCWQQQVAGLATSYGLDQLPLRVQVNHDSLLPAAARPIDGCGVSIERDQNAYRGTGGTLHDIAEDYDDNDLLLVANGGQVLTRSLVDLTHQLHELEADVSFVAHEDGTPSGLMMVRCKTLRAIASKGYVDMKEQALPAIARRFRVAHLDQRRATGLPLHTFKDYLAAVRWWHRHGRSEATLGADAIHSAQARVWEMQASFNIVESGATVAPGAYLHDSVVLRGSIVGAGAVVARSVLCAGSLLEENETAVDELLTGRASTKAPTRRVLQTA
jgi:NDP-sugar pyrophosphorylase family protein